MFEKKSILVYDIECDSLDTSTSVLKWFGAYSYFDNEYYLFPFKGNEKDVIALIRRHKVLVSFNGKNFDNHILINNIGDDDLFEYKVLVDLYEISAPKGSGSFGAYNKGRLVQMGIKMKNFTLRSIIDNLKLDEDGTKGDIDYTIFQKDKWTPEESAEILKYLKQDIVLTKKLLEWYEVQFSPLKKFLSEKDRDNLLYLKSSLAVLGYKIICNKAGLEADFGEKTKREPYAGGHHISNREDITKGNIVEIDIVSAYPHALMMGNLYSPAADGWSGSGFYQLEGKYNAQHQGKVELALKEIFLERLKAKKDGDKPKDKSFKVVINSVYGLTGNPVFKSLYNRTSASDCTSMVRTWLKTLAKRLEAVGFIPLYGFTDSIFVKVPEGYSKKHLMYIVKRFVKDVKESVPFPMDTFNLGIEEEIKMIWFVAKNCYLFVTHDDKVVAKSTLLNTNTPKVIMMVYEDYMKPKIIKELDINFTEKELEDQIKLIISNDSKLAAVEYKVTELTDYKVQTSLHYQISEAYGSGRHFLIPNKKGIGVGKKKNTKNKIAVRHCSIEEYNEKKLTVDDIDLTNLLSHLKPFILATKSHLSARN